MRQVLGVWVGVAVFVLVFGLSAPRARSGEEPWRAPARAARKQNPLTVNSTVLTAGKKLYAQECLSCHGKQGRGDGPKAKDLERPPGNLTNAEQMQAQTDGELFWKISEGNKPMPSFKQELTEEERWQLVHYLRALAAQEKPQ